MKGVTQKNNPVSLFILEMLDLIRFSEAKATEEGLETAIASETSLKRDRLGAEEDEAWQDL